MTRSHVDFVTRLKDDALYGVVEQRTVPEGTDILRDEVILLVSQQEIGPEAQLRRIEVWVEEKQGTLVFVTNNLRLAARTIARIYKERWQILGSGVKSAVSGLNSFNLLALASIVSARLSIIGEGRSLRACAKTTAH